jgi:transcriptional antiterminator NusG
MTGSDFKDPYFSDGDYSGEVRAGEAVSWPFSLNAGAGQVKLAFAVDTGPDSANAPEWNVALFDTAEGELWSNYRSKSEILLDVPGSGPKELRLEVICPKGARYGDEVEITVTASSPAGNASVNFNAVAKQSIMVLKTQIDQEKSVADSLLAKSNTGEKDLYAILSPANLRGYLFVEGMNTDRLREKTRDIRKARPSWTGRPP